MMNLKFMDMEPEQVNFRMEVVNGLKKVPKDIPPKFFYDERGSELFEKITKLKEYYITRSELQIIRDNRSTLSSIIGRDATLIEFGCGNLSKARLFLDLCKDVSRYVAVDISRDFLYTSAEQLSSDYPDIMITAICADFMKQILLPEMEVKSKKVGLFLGSSIGNFEPELAENFIIECSRVMRPGDNLIIGADNKKDSRVIEKAYNDSEGITAAFNMNLLRRINTELNGNFDLQNFSHRAFYNSNKGRIEMHLVAGKSAEYSVGGENMHFSTGESIHTENSYKYSTEEFVDLASRGNFSLASVLQDPSRYFSLYVLEKRKSIFGTSKVLKNIRLHLCGETFFTL